MTVITDIDLKRLEDLIIAGHKATETRLTAIETRLTGIENNQIEMKADLKAVQKDVIELKIGQAKVTEKLEGMDERLKTLEGSQRNQIWTLITLLSGSLIAVGFRSFFMGNNP